MQESPAGSFWARREAQASLGKDNGLKPFTTKVFYAAVSIYRSNIYILYDTPPISDILFSSATPKTNMYNNVVTTPGIRVCFHTEKNRVTSFDDKV